MNVARSQPAEAATALGARGRRHNLARVQGSSRTPSALQRAREDGALATVAPRLHVSVGYADSSSLS